LTKEEAYDRCTADGAFLPKQEVDSAMIESMLKISEEDLKTIQELKKKGDRWNTLYKLSYDVLHILCEALVLFEKVKSLNHQCLFAYICVKHPELELDWDFFELIRTKRNGIHYYGTSVNKDDWIRINVQISLYVKLLTEQIGKKLKEHK